MADLTLSEQRLRRAEQAVLTLPERYLGAPAGFDATVELRLGDVGRSWAIRLQPDRCRVMSPARGDARVVIGTDASTWLALREGRLSGLDAFSRRRLDARGDLDLALAFESMFHLPGGRPPLLRVHDVDTSAGRISAISSGTGPEPVICIHGLGGAKSSFFATIAALAPDHTVHAIDLPGFGSSDKPARAPYDARWFARIIGELMDGLGIARAHLVGNSMGGRVALETALREPERVQSLGLLAPALAFLRNRGLVPLVKLLRPELAALPHSLAESRVRGQFWSMFARPERLDPVVADVACDEFLRNYGSRSARVAFYSSARNIYLDAPHGEQGLWTRLAGLKPPAMFVWGTEDRLVPASFAGHVARALPHAEQVVISDCGHVPQIELPEQTNGLLRRHIERNPALPAPTAAAPGSRSPIGRAARSLASGRMAQGRRAHG